MHSFGLTHLFTVAPVIIAASSKDGGVVAGGLQRFSRLAVNTVAPGCAFPILGYLGLNDVEY
ncbi:hypothetical protein [Ferrimicrobium sp.]|uniref:hypothetical protein n=1 Tax=Ferrimicrobium sp. TaxID=2926050 RepID=UPI0026127AAE|nr:hypothetical protein [Ferrimicrobium sp.]